MITDTDYTSSHNEAALVLIFGIWLLLTSGGFMIPSFTPFARCTHLLRQKSIGGLITENRRKFNGVSK